MFSHLVRTTNRSFPFALLLLGLLAWSPVQAASAKPDTRRARTETRPLLDASQPTPPPAKPTPALPPVAPPPSAPPKPGAAKPGPSAPPAVTGILNQLDVAAINNSRTLKPWGNRSQEYSYEGRRIRTTDLTYYSHSYQGKVVRIFGYLSRPAKVLSHSLPALLIIHGAGGYAVRERAEEAAARGYIALAIDLPGHGEGRGRSRSGGPDMSVSNLFRLGPSLQDNYLYHCVTAVRRGLTMLLDCPETDPQRLGMYGMSWGGVLTLLTCSTDRRVTAAVNLYGGGFLSDGSTWIEHIFAQNRNTRLRWRANFDPAVYVKQITCPVLSITGTNDGCFWLPGWVQTQTLLNDKCRLLLLPNLNHKIDETGRNALWAWLASSLKHKRSPSERIVGWKYETDTQGLHFSVWTAGDDEPVRVSFTRLGRKGGWATASWQTTDTARTGDRFDIWVTKPVATQYLYATAHYANGLSISTPVYAIWVARYPYGWRYYDSPLMAQGTYFARVEKMAVDMGGQPAAPLPGDQQFEVRNGDNVARVSIQMVDGRRYAQVRDMAQALGASLHWQRNLVFVRPRALKAPAAADTQLTPNQSPGPHNPLYGQAADGESRPAAPTVDVSPAPECPPG